MNVVLSTDRLILRKVSMDDAAFILKILNDKGFLDYIGDRKVKTIEDAKKYIQKSFLKSYEDNGFGMYAVQVKSTKDLVGLCGLVNRPTLDDIDIGFAFLQAHCGKGYGYESSKSVLDFAFTDLNIKKIVGITLETNIASRKLLEKIGLSFEKNILYENGEELMMYSVVREN